MKAPGSVLFGYVLALFFSACTSKDEPAPKVFVFEAITLDTFQIEQIDFNIVDISALSLSRYLELQFFLTFKHDSAYYGITKCVVTHEMSGKQWEIDLRSRPWSPLYPRTLDVDFYTDLAGSISLGKYRVTLINASDSTDVHINYWARNDTNLTGTVYSDRFTSEPTVFNIPTIDSVMVKADSVEVNFQNTDTLTGHMVEIFFSHDKYGLYFDDHLQISGHFPAGRCAFKFKKNNNYQFFCFMLYSHVLKTFDSDYVVASSYMTQP